MSIDLDRPDGCCGCVLRACAHLKRPFDPDNCCTGLFGSYFSSWQVLETCVPPYRGPVALMPTELEVFDYNLDIHDSELESQEDDLRLRVRAVHNLV